MDDIKTWKCGHCPFTLPLPPPAAYLYDLTVQVIREHRLSHLIVVLAGATDDDLLGMCEDKPVNYDLVRGGDAKPVLAGIERLLKDDLPRARKEQDNV